MFCGRKLIKYFKTAAVGDINSDSMFLVWPSDTSAGVDHQLVRTITSCQEPASFMAHSPSVRRH